MSQSTQASQWKHHQLIVSQIPVTNKSTGPIGIDRKWRGRLSAAASQNIAASIKFCIRFLIILKLISIFGMSWWAIAVNKPRKKHVSLSGLRVNWYLCFCMSFRTRPTPGIKLIAVMSWDYAVLVLYGDRQEKFDQWFGPGKKQLWLPTCKRRD